MKPDAQLRIDWVALVDDPALFTTLPVDAQDAAYRQVAQLEAALRAMILTRRAQSAPSPPPDPDQVIRLRDAAQRLGMSVDFLHRSWKALGGFRDHDRRIKFTLRTIARHVRSREQGR